MQYWILIVIVIILILVVIEYLYQDCINGTNSKKGWNHVVPPTAGDSIEVKLNTILKMIRSNYNYVIWRQCLVVALLAGFLVGFCLYQRLPTLLEFSIIAILVFILTYLAGGWFATHYLYPNNNQIEKSIRQLQANLHNVK